ncbi:MAG: hypothetical protein JO166_22140 [Deltaproteobacteria bacterium]|nr:hypothetical protein [Deltaproteobacteria bacterium]
MRRKDQLCGNLVKCVAQHERPPRPSQIRHFSAMTVADFADILSHLGSAIGVFTSGAEVLNGVFEERAFTHGLPQSWGWVGDAHDEWAQAFPNREVGT